MGRLSWQENINTHGIENMAFVTFRIVNKREKDLSYRMIANNQLITQIGSEKEQIPVQDDTCVMRLQFYGFNNTRNVIK